MKKSLMFSIAGFAAASLALAPAVFAKNAPIRCSIEAYDGHYLTAVSGGGRTSEALHTDASQVGGWEKFVLEDLDLGTSNITYGIRTKSGNYLTAVGGGGRSSDVIHSNATQPQAWERFQLIAIGYGYYAIQTSNGHYLTAVNSGGLAIADVLHSDATKVGSWEKFRLNCGI